MTRFCHLARRGFLRGAFYQARAQARRGFWRGAAPFKSPPPPDGTGGIARNGTESGAKGLISLSEQVFSPASRRRPKQRRRNGGRDGDGGRATGEHGDNRAVAKQARPRKRGFPEPALYSAGSRDRAGFRYGFNR